MAERVVVGPYETESAAGNEPLLVAVRDLHRKGLIKSGDTDRRCRNTVMDHVLAACDQAGLEVGAYDRRTLEWLAGWEETTAQVMIGLISRAYAAGVAAGKADHG